MSNGVVIVQGGKIMDAGANVAIPQGAQVIDLGDATLSPGFIDAHTHLTADFSQPVQRTPLEGNSKRKFRWQPTRRFPMRSER